MFWGIPFAMRDPPIPRNIVRQRPINFGCQRSRRRGHWASLFSSPGNALAASPSPVSAHRAGRIPSRNDKRLPRGVESRKEKRRTGLARSQTFLQLQVYEIDVGGSQGQARYFMVRFRNGKTPASNQTALQMLAKRLVRRLRRRQINRRARNRGLTPTAQQIAPCELGWLALQAAIVL